MAPPPPLALLFLCLLVSPSVGTPGTASGAGPAPLSILQVEQEVAAMLLSPRRVEPLLFRSATDECVPLARLLADWGLDTQRGVDLPVLLRRGRDLIDLAKSCRPPLGPPVLLSGSDAKTVSSGNLSRNSSVTGKGLRDVKAKVWISSIIAIVVISAVGLLGVAVVPLMQKVFYNHVIQFLVALAVGSLTGDAMLHLLPHSITAGDGEHGADEEDEGNEKQAILKGLVALGGLYFFFIAEKLVAIISEFRAEKKAEEEERKKAAQASRKPSTLNDFLSGEKQRRRSVFCDASPSAVTYENTVTVGLSSKAMKEIDTLNRYREAEDGGAGCMEEANVDDNATEGTKLTCHQLPPPCQVEYRAGNGGASHDGAQRHSVRILVPKELAEESATDLAVERRRKSADDNDEEKRTGDGHDHGHGQGHGHGHSHEVPDSIAAVAWMVILGDGLHNFTDGLAIGAAFAKDFTGGLSTSIAVFCHELPHELGDFAVLLTTGMSVKQALFYNIVSSVLCLIGMFIGIALGNVESASYWIFAITAGIFIYIALVDMLPELGSINLKPGESRIAHFIIQNCGIMTGVGIMLLIAMFEKNIKAAFD